MCYQAKMCMLHYMSLKLTIDTIVARLEASFSDAWMNTNMLKINKDKAELIIFSPNIKASVFPSCTINFDGQIIEAPSFVKKNSWCTFRTVSSYGWTDKFNFKTMYLPTTSYWSYSNTYYRKCLQYLSVFTRYL